MKKSELLFNTLLAPVDFLMITLAGLTTYFLRTEFLSRFRPVLFELNLPLEKYFLLVLFVSALFVVVFAVAGLYKFASTRSSIEEFFKITIASSAGIMILIIYIFLRQELFNSRFLVLGGWLLAIIFVVLGRAVMRKIQRSLVANYNFGIHRVLIIGNDEISKRIAGDIRKNPASGYRVIKELKNPEVEDVEAIIGPDPSDQGSSIFVNKNRENLGIDEVILANPNFPAEKVVQIIDFCNEHNIAFKFVPNIYQTLTANFSVDVFSSVPIIELKRTNLDGWGRVAKRIADIIGSILALVFLLPLFLIVAFAIKWETDGPVFVKLRRVSQNKEFNLLKFRSMVKNAEELKAYLQNLNERSDGPLFKIKNDPRVTKVGKILRKYRLDELPQFFNVLKGEISLVGPRPHQPDEITKYQKHHKKVLAIKAGATGLAQISGSSDLPFEEEITLDSFYVENWSLSQDIKIILKTAIKMLRDKSAA